MKKSLASFIVLLCILINPAFGQGNPAYCESTLEYRQFDFWLGEWEVETPAGENAGENSITKHENGCLLRENWRSAGGGTGHSINYYDPSDKLWKQVWTDAGGNIAYFQGGLEDGAMVLKGKWITRDGNSYLLNGTWSKMDDGRVRQFFQSSNDDGKTWATWFDGYYKKKEKSR